MGLLDSIAIALGMSPPDIPVITDVRDPDVLGPNGLGRLKTSEFKSAQVHLLFDFDARTVRIRAPNGSATTKIRAPGVKVNVFHPRPFTAEEEEVIEEAGAIDITGDFTAFSGTECLIEMVPDTKARNFTTYTPEVMIAYGPTNQTQAVLVNRPTGGGVYHERTGKNSLSIWAWGIKPNRVYNSGNLINPNTPTFEERRDLPIRAVRVWISRIDNAIGNALLNHVKALHEETWAREDEYQRSILDAVIAVNKHAAAMIADAGIEKATHLLTGCNPITGFMEGLFAMNESGKILIANPEKGVSWTGSLKGIMAIAVEDPNAIFKDSAWSLVVEHPTQSFDTRPGEPLHAVLMSGCKSESVAPWVAWFNGPAQQD